MEAEAAYNEPLAGVSGMCRAVQISAYITVIYVSTTTCVQRKKVSRNERCYPASHCCGWLDSVHPWHVGNSQHTPNW